MSSLRRLAAPVTLLAILVGAWELAVRARGIDAAVFSPPSDVARALVDHAGTLTAQSATTLGETALGLVIGIVVGLTTALVISGWPTARRAVEPVLVTLQTVPAVVLAPILVLAFGFGWAPRVVVVVGVVFFPIAITAAGAFTAVDPALLDLVRTFRASTLQRYVHVVVPGALPAIFDGLRISAAYALGSAAIAEQIGGARSGLGLFIARSQRNFRADQVLAGVVVIALLSLVIYSLIGWIGRRLTPWTNTGPEASA